MSGHARGWGQKTEASGMLGARGARMMHVRVSLCERGVVGDVDGVVGMSVVER